MIHKLSSSFNAGELSPLMDSRVAVEKYESGCRKLRNFVLQTHGPVFRRPGMEYLGDERDHGVASRFIEFNYSADTTFMIEMAQGVFRFWRSGVMVMKDGSPYEVSHPYQADEFFQVQVKQINDVMYMCHPERWPWKLSRLANDVWRSEMMPTTYPALLDEGKLTKADAADGAGVEHEGPLRTGFDEFDNEPGQTYEVYVEGMNETVAKNLRASIKLMHEEYDDNEWDSWITFRADSEPPTLFNGVLYRGTITSYGEDLRLDYDQEIGDADDGISGRMGIRVFSGSSTGAPIKVRVDEDNVMHASHPLFKDDPAGEGSHVGSYWQIVHRRNDAFDDIRGLPLSGEGDTGTIPEGTEPYEETDAISDPVGGLMVLGRWDVYSYGTWNGTMMLQQRVLKESEEWETIRSWSGNYDRNFIASGTVEKDTQMRLKADGDILYRSAQGVAAPRFLIEAGDTRTYGLVKVISVESDTECTVEIINELESDEETPNWTEGAWSSYRGYPAAIGLYEQRLWFGGTKKNPQSLWASVSGDFENFRRSTQDDAGIFRTLAADSANSIRWISSASALLVGTGAEVWAISAGQDSQPITPVNMNAVRQSGYSSNSVPAKLAHEVTLFVQRDGRRLRQLSYTQAQESYTAADLTVLAPHVTEGGIKQLAFQQSPTAIVWAVTGQGRLIGMTFEREQNVFGWHVHSTFSRAEDDPEFDPEDGKIETVAVLQGTPSDEVWLGVKRKIDGGYRRYVERISPSMMTGEFPDRSKLPYSDSYIYFDFLTYKYDANGKVMRDGGGNELAGPTPALELEGIEQPEGLRRVITGLEHLEGRQVVILGDGVVQPPRGVQGGRIIIQDFAREVIVGLPYESVLQPMKQEISLPDGTAQGRRFKLNGVTVRVIDSLGGEVCANPADPTVPWEPLQKRDITMPVDSAAPLFTGERDLILESRHEAAVNLTLRATEPLPLNVTALIFKYDVYGV